MKMLLSIALTFTLTTPVVFAGGPNGGSGPTCKDAVKQFKGGLKKTKKALKKVKKACAGKKVKETKCVKALAALKKGTAAFDQSFMDGMCSPGGGL